MEIKIKDDGTALIDGVEYVKKSNYDVRAIPGKYYALDTEEGRKEYERDCKAKQENPWFVPKKDDFYYTLETPVPARCENQSIFDAVQRLACTDVTIPCLRSDYAERVAFGMSELAIWKAMGVGIGGEGEIRWWVNNEEALDCWKTIEAKSRQDALFLTEEDAEAALEEFGWERLRAARLAVWGK